MSALPSLVALQKELQTGAYVNTNSKLYDQFIELRRGYNKQEPTFNRDYAVATLSLAHPSKPDAQDALTLLMTHYRKPGAVVAAESLPADDLARHGFSRMWYRTATILRCTDRATDADMLAQRYQELFGEPLTLKVVTTGIRYRKLKV